MAIFFTIVILLLPFLLVWWLISPAYYPFAKTPSRLKIALHSILAFLALLIVLAITVPPPDEPTSKSSDIIGLLLAMVALVLLIIRSVKIKKSRVSVLAQTETKSTFTQTLTEPQKEIEENQQNKTIAHQAIIEEETKIRENQDVQFQTQQEMLRQALADLQEELRATKAELSQTQDKLTENGSAFEEVLKNTKELLESHQRNHEPTKPEPKKIQKPAPNHDLVLGNDNVCIINYTGSDSKTSSRSIIPRELKLNKNGNWLISAVDVDASRVKSFRVDRISHLSYNGQEFTNQNDILSTLRAIEITL